MYDLFPIYPNISNFRGTGFVQNPYFRKYRWWVVEVAGQWPEMPKHHHLHAAIAKMRKPLCTADAFSLINELTKKEVRHVVYWAYRFRLGPGSPYTDKYGPKHPIDDTAFDFVWAPAYDDDPDPPAPDCFMHK